MARFNQTKKDNKTTSYEGGLNYHKNVTEDWINMIFSCVLEDRFYENSQQQQERFMDLTTQVAEKHGWEFVARAAHFVRNELGLRTISELTAAILNGQSFENKRAFFRNYFKRPDGVAEVFAAIDNIGGKRSHALIRGAADYLSGLNAYTIGKYPMHNRTYNMFDIINLTHAKSKVIDSYMKGTLETPDTWEAKISTAENKEERDQEWMRLVQEKKLGYLALIRNLRNILNVGDISADFIKNDLCPAIENEDAIRKSLVFPYQIYCAAKNIDLNILPVRASLDKAFRLACKNMPKLDGETLVVLDVSGSMEDRFSANSSLTIKEVGAVYAAAIFLANPAHTDFIKFGSDCKKKTYHHLEDVFDTIKKMQDNEDCGYGTSIGPVYESLKLHYDRMFLISDMQVMDNSRRYYYSGTGLNHYNEYVNKFGRCKCYSFDLGNYPTQTSNPNNKDVYLATSLSSKFFDIISFLEDDGSNLVDYINKNYSCV